MYIHSYTLYKSSRAFLDMSCNARSKRIYIYIYKYDVYVKVRKRQII